MSGKRNLCKLKIPLSQIFPPGTAQQRQALINNKPFKKKGAGASER